MDTMRYFLLKYPHCYGIDVKISSWYCIYVKDDGQRGKVSCMSWVTTVVAPGGLIGSISQSA